MQYLNKEGLIHLRQKLNSGTGSSSGTSNDGVPIFKMNDLLTDAALTIKGDLRIYDFENDIMDMNDAGELVFFNEDMNRVFNKPDFNVLLVEGGDEDLLTFYKSDYIGTNFEGMIGYYTEGAGVSENYANATGICWSLLSYSRSCIRLQGNSFVQKEELITPCFILNSSGGLLKNKLVIIRKSF